jgi:hypothetical protein
MTTKVPVKITVELAENLYARAQRFARLHQQGMDEAISALIEQGLAAEEGSGEVLDWTEPDPAVDREREAYIAMHPKLKEQYFGKYVAVYHGELVDSDDDPAALSERVHNKHPGEFIWLTQVREEPIQTIVVRSPRIVRDKVS